MHCAHASALVRGGGSRDAERFRLQRSLLYEYPQLCAHAPPMCMRICIDLLGRSGSLDLPPTAQTARERGQRNPTPQRAAPPTPLGAAQMSGIGNVTTSNPQATKSKPKMRSTIQAFLKRYTSGHGDDSLSGSAYEGQNAADILAKQSDMLQQLQHVLIEERWQHRQHSLAMENELQSLHDIIRKHEESDVGVSPSAPHFPRCIRTGGAVTRTTPAP